MSPSPMVPSSYFPFRPDLQIGEGEIVLVSNCRNELARLPYFLEYYRGLGVDRFLIIDNNSDDGTTEYLQAQPDVEYFFTDASYRGALSGRLWTQELADTYAVGRWVLTADADELLVYPGIESVDLPELCAYLDDQRVRGLYAFMLDMYADVPLSEAVYRPGTDFLETCRWFEVDTYHLTPGQYPPFLKVEGGPRSSLYDDRPQQKGPESTKVPLVKWERGFSYIASSHSHRQIPLADISGVLLHFKFFSSWTSVVMRDAKRGDQIGFYDKYADEYGTSDPIYWRPESIEYRGAAQLVELGVVRTTPTYADWLEKTRVEDDRPHEPGSEALAVSVHTDATRLDLRAFSQVWDLFNNPSIPSFFGADERVNHDTRKNFMRRLLSQVAVIDVLADRILLDLRHPVLHVGRASKVEITVYVDDREVVSLPLGGDVSGLSVDTSGMFPNTYRWDLDVAGLVDRADATISIYLRDLTVPDRQPGEIVENDHLLHSDVWSPTPVAADPERFQGGLEAVVDGSVVGWIFDHDQQRYRVPLTVRINGRVVAYGVPHQHRPGLKRLVAPTERLRPVGFSIALPLGFFEENEPGPLQITVSVAGANLLVAHAPFVLPEGVRSLWWDETTLQWVTSEPVPASEDRPSAVVPDRGPAWRRAGSRVKRALKG
jgi:hypothetical protein